MDDLTKYDLTPAPTKYEYLDHTADVQLHAWGETMEEAFEQCAIAMFAYTTELDTVEMTQIQEIDAEAEDLPGLLYHFLDELLFMFCTEPYLVARKVKITEYDPVNFRIKAIAIGETFRIGKHPQGAEIKAITYSAMKIYDRPEVERPEVFVIVDI